MTSFNGVFLIGNLNREPDFALHAPRETGCRHHPAINRALKAEDGTKHEKPLVDVTLWPVWLRSQITSCAKGNPVFIEGRLQLDLGNTMAKNHSRLRVIAHSLQLLGKRSDPSPYHQHAGGKQNSRQYPCRCQPPHQGADRTGSGHRPSN